MVTRPDILAPAGDRDAMRAAVRAGADAVYFGLKGHNARARAKNIDAAELPEVMSELHAWGVKGYVTLNVLAFDHELASVERAIRDCAAAGVDAIIVQDLGVIALARAVAPTLEVHASTQMTCSDAASVELAHAMGATRVVLARELSIDEIARIRAQTAVELEVFVHGALCVSYSGQCLTSEAIGGRSANRGACAQACRLPYDLVVDGAVRDLGDLAYLLSPGDLEAASLVPQLAALDVQCLKIEGRLKGPEYVAATTRLYRSVVDGLVTRDGVVDDVVVDATLRREALLTFSRGSDTGFLGGVDHQRLVEAKTCEHRGVVAGVVDAVVRDRQRRSLQVTLEAPLKRGDGVLIEGGKKNAGERGGRVWELFTDGVSVERVERGPCTLWLGPDLDVDDVVAGRRIFHNDDPALDKAILQRVEREPVRERVDLVVEGDLGAPFLLRARTARGRTAVVRGEGEVSAARNQPLTVEVLRDKLGRLGDTPFVLGELRSALPGNSTIPLSALNRARRALADALVAAGQRHHATSTSTADTLVASASAWLATTSPSPTSTKSTTSTTSTTSTAATPGSLFVLARTLDQARAALDAGADGVWLDFLAMTGLSTAIEELRRASTGAFIGVAPPRIRKAGEEKITKFLASLDADGMLVRGLGALHELATSPSTTSAKPRQFVGDFSLNVANRLAAREVLARGLQAFTPSFDLDEEQLTALLGNGVGARCELVVHHPMPLFHTEHCVFAATLSGGKGHDFRTCGRPCEHHTIALRDRVGLEHPVEADVGCRNTVFHSQPQSAAGLVAVAQKAGVARFRIELVRERSDDVTRLVRGYRSLLAGEVSSKELLKTLRTQGGYGVVKGSLRVLDAQVVA